MTNKANTDIASQMVIIGGSAGAMTALKTFLPQIKLDEKTALVIVFHQYPHGGLSLEVGISQLAAYPVIEVSDQEPILAQHVYVCPANYHTLVEGKDLLLNCEPPVNFSRPSIDVVFESAAEEFAEDLVGVILSGANSDGQLGSKRIKDFGGRVIIQSCESAEVDTMPRSVRDAGLADYEAKPEDIADIVSGCLLA